MISNDIFGQWQSDINLHSEVQQDDITARISAMFDYEFDGKIDETIKLPIFPQEFNLGLIVGSSGSGKSTIAKMNFGEFSEVDWDNTKCIASHFDSFEEASNKLGASGLNSIPTWLKPYRVLSTGEKFRADIARLLHDGVVIDEFTSVVNRETAISCSCAMSKYIRANNIKNVVLVSCHDDIIPYLNPDWVYNTDTKELTTGRYARPAIELQVVACTAKAWDKFKKYHYLTNQLNKSADCYMALYNDIPVAFLATLPLPSGSLHDAWKEHRLVVLPDYQGMGIGNKFSEFIAQAYVDIGKTYYAKTANPRIGEHRNRSTLWKATSSNNKCTPWKHDGKAILSDDLIDRFANRICYSHEFVGNKSNNSINHFSHEKECVKFSPVSLF